MKSNLLGLGFALGVLGSQVAFAQSVPTGLASVIGAPFSGVRTQQAARNFVDGNRIDTGRSSHLYRDSQGRTRVEQEVPADLAAANPQMEPVQITISDPVSGERYELHPRSKTAIVFKGRASPTVRLPVAAPPAFITFGRHLYGATDPGWSAPVSLGEKSIDGIRSVGAQRQYTIPVGSVGNEKPIVLTVEQWFSPELGLLVMKSGRASTGGEFEFQVENIVRGEPDPALFTIPPDYSRIEAGQLSSAAH